jgi:Uma2 family endonuclease
MATPAPGVHYTFRQYLELEEASNVKHEFLAGRIHAMAGGTPEHAALAATLIGLLQAQLRGSPCRVFTSDLRVRVLETGLATYPDITIACGELLRDPESRQTLVSPRVLVELPSDGTENHDRNEKLAHYQRIPSLEEYVLVSHRERLVEVWRRLDTGSWERTEARSGRAARLHSIPCEIDVDTLYREALRDDAPGS